MTPPRPCQEASVRTLNASWISTSTSLGLLDAVLGLRLVGGRGHGGRRRLGFDKTRRCRRYRHPAWTADDTLHGAFGLHVLYADRIAERAGFLGLAAQRQRQPG